MQIAFTLPMLNFRPKVNQNAVHRAADQPTFFPARLKLDRERSPLSDVRHARHHKPWTITPSHRIGSRGPWRRREAAPVRGDEAGAILGKRREGGSRRSATSRSRPTAARCSLLLTILASQMQCPTKRPQFGAGRDLGPPERREGGSRGSASSRSHPARRRWSILLRSG